VDNDKMQLLREIDLWTTMFKMCSVGGHDRLFHVAYRNKGYSQEERYYKRYDDAILKTYHEVRFRALITCEMVTEDRKKRGSV